MTGSPSWSHFAFDYIQLKPLQVQGPDFKYLRAILDRFELNMCDNYIHNRTEYYNDLWEGNNRTKVHRSNLKVNDV